MSTTISKELESKALDLTKGYPRSPNESLGHFVLLPRIIDKCRATLVGKNGEYNYNCPLDKIFFNFAEVDADKLQEQVAQGKCDEDLLTWVQANSKKLSNEEILAWGYQQRWRRPEGEMVAYFENMRNEQTPNNYKIETWFQLLDADEKRF